jgi:hypothetical protein
VAQAGITPSEAVEEEFRPESMTAGRTLTHNNRGVKVPKTVTIDSPTIGDILFAGFCAHLSIAALGGSTPHYASASRQPPKDVAQAGITPSDAVEEEFRPESMTADKH